MFLDGESDDEGMNGVNPMKKVKISKQNGFEESTSFGPHVIKVMDEDMLDRVCQKYKKMGHSVQLRNNIIKLNQIKSDTCLQEEVSLLRNSFFFLNYSWRWIYDRDCIIGGQYEIYTFVALN